jgi:hypothetical protein
VVVFWGGGQNDTQSGHTFAVSDPTESMMSEAVCLAKQGPPDPQSKQLCI